MPTMESENFIRDFLTRANLFHLQERFEEQGIDKSALLLLMRGASGSLEERLFFELVPRIGERIRIIEAVSSYQYNHENTDQISDDNNIQESLSNIKINDKSYKRKKNGKRNKEIDAKDKKLSTQISNIVTLFNKSTEERNVPSGKGNTNLYDPSEHKNTLQGMDVERGDWVKKTNDGAEKEKAENKPGPSRPMRESKLAVDKKIVNKINASGKNGTNKDPKTDEERLKNEKLQKATIIGGAAVATGVVAGVAAVAAAPLVVAGVGFTATGIAASSIAAGFQSIIGSVAAGSLFASLTSAGMAGMAATTTVAIGATAGGVAAAGAAVAGAVVAGTAVDEAVVAGTAVDGATAPGRVEIDLATNSMKRFQPGRNFSDSRKLLFKHKQNKQSDRQIILYDDILFPSDEEDIDVYNIDYNGFSSNDEN